MSENNKLSKWSFIGILIIVGILFKQAESLKEIERKTDLAWEDITIVRDNLLSELDEIKKKLDDLEFEIQNMH